MLFDATDYDKLHSIVFQDGYPGFKPDVTEIPNGAGKADTLKRYAHIAPKYFNNPMCKLNPLDLNHLHRMYIKALNHAQDMFSDVGGNSKWAPDYRYSALRILDYPSGATSAPHRDFDLFTLMLYRDQPDRFKVWDEEKLFVLDELRKRDPQVHIGEMGELLGMGTATEHEVLASETRQKSIVFFAIPAHDQVLKSDYSGDLTVLSWLNERLARSRTLFTEYK